MVSCREVNTGPNDVRIRLSSFVTRPPFAPCGCKGPFQERLASFPDFQYFGFCRRKWKAFRQAHTPNPPWQQSDHCCHAYFTDWGCFTAWSKNSVLAERIQHRKRKSFNNLPTHYSKEASSSDLGSGSMHFPHAVTPPCHSLMVLQRYSSKSNVTVDWFCLEKISCFSTRLII